MKPKNILLITVRADHGGGPKHVDLIIKNLSADHNLFLACPDDKPYFEEWKNLDKIKELMVIPHRKLTVKHFFKFISFCRLHKIDIIHSHGKGAGFYSRLARIFLADIQVIHTFHGIHTGEYSSFQKYIYIFIERLFSRLTDKFINVSEGERNICLKNRLFKPQGSHVIYNAIVPQARTASPKPSSLAGKFVVATVSRFDFPKNMKQAYDIAKNFKDHPGIVFLWVGDGDDKEALKALSVSEGLNNIVFTGFSDNVNQFLSWSDVYLSTSRWEGLPYALIEAASLNLPIIASDVVGNNEVVSHGYNGYLYQLNNIDQAVEYITLISANQELQKVLSSNAYQSFLNNFQIQSMMDKLEIIYNQK